MTAENRQHNIREELNRSASALGSAKLLIDGGYLSDAISRLYYYLLYHVRALLLTKGIEPKSHEAALRLYSMHFIKEGPLPTSASHLFTRLMKYREEADYNPSYTFESEEVRTWLSEAEALTGTIRNLIVAEGFSL